MVAVILVALHNIIGGEPLHIRTSAFISDRSGQVTVGIVAVILVVPHNIFGGEPLHIRTSVDIFDNSDPVTVGIVAVIIVFPHNIIGGEPLHIRTSAVFLICDKLGQVTVGIVFVSFVTFDITANIKNFLYVWVHEGGETDRYSFQGITGDVL